MFHCCRNISIFVLSVRRALQRIKYSVGLKRPEVPSVLSHFPRTAKVRHLGGHGCVRQTLYLQCWKCLFIQKASRVLGGRPNCVINTRTGSSEVIYFVIFFLLCVIKENCTLEFSIHLKFSSDTFIYLSYWKLGTDCVKQRIVLHQIRSCHIVFYCIRPNHIVLNCIIS